MHQFPPKKILIAMDSSELSFHAFRHGAALADIFKAELDVLHVRVPLPLLEMAYLQPETLYSIQEGIERGLRARVGSAAHWHVQEGEPADVINTWAREDRPDLVVMGTHGRKGLSRVALGSVAEGVVRDCPVPVMAVKSAPKPLRSVLAAVKLEPSEQALLDYAARFAAKNRASLTVFHAVAYLNRIMPARRSLAAMVSKLDPVLRRGISPDLLVLGGDPSEAILSEAKNHQALIVTARKKRLLKDIALGTTAERVLRYCPIPVVAIPGPLAEEKKEKIKAALGLGKE